MTRSAGPVLAGVDLGGTNLRVGIVTRDGDLLAFVSERFDAAHGASAGMSRMAELIRNGLASAGQPPLGAIGVGATGPLDPQAGRVRNPHTLPTWSDVDVRGPLHDLFHVPVVLENDAVAAALGEWWQGAGRGSACLAMVTFGTGIGVAVVRREGPYRGAGQMHPEAGHQVLDPSGPLCYCGSRGCWEQLAAGPAIARMATASRDPALRSVDAAEVVRLSRTGNREARRIVRSAAHLAALGLVNVVAFYAPDTIVLGGGVMEAYRTRMPAMRSLLDRSLGYLPPRSVRLVLTQLGDRAGVLGAASVAMRAVGGHEMPDQPSSE